jgi:hypothetical protein
LILGTKTMIVLSSDEAVKDLLDKKSGNYSDRPGMYIGQTIASGGLRLVVMVSHVQDHTLSRCAFADNRTSSDTERFGEQSTRRFITS